MFSKTDIQQQLGTAIVGQKLFVFDTIDSTNICAKTLAESGCEDGTAVIAEGQTSGKGRLGRSWMAERGTNLLFSVVLHPSIRPEQAGLLALFASVAVSSGIEEAAQIETSCKWPNDLFLKEKKCCGILIESSLTTTAVNYTVIGIGVNVNQTQFDTSLAGQATSLKLASGREIDRMAILRTILRHLDRYYTLVQANSWNNILSDWRKRSAMLGKEIFLYRDGIPVRGIACDIAEDGGLIVQSSAGKQIYYSGEVTLHGSPAAHLGE